MKRIKTQLKANIFNSTKIIYQLNSFRIESYNLKKKLGRELSLINNKKTMKRQYFIFY